MNDNMETTTLLETVKQQETIQPEHWTEIIRPKSGWLDINLREIWRYRDLLMLFVRRDFVALYKQTILGPLWIFIQPLLTSFTYVIIFSKVAHLSSDGLPPILFYLAGVTCWNYFAYSLNTTANTFITNAPVFGKVYFPRLIMPLSVSVSNLVKFLIQFGLLVIMMIWYALNGVRIAVNIYLLVLPLLLIIMAGLSLGLGIIVSSLTTKYRDLSYLITFSVQLLMYASPVVYPLSSVPKGKLHLLLVANPMSGPIEAFKYMLLGKGYFSWGLLGYDFGFMIVTLVAGILLFNRIEKTFMDTV
jgi:lipopolysaccharide transport system permease protein